MWAMRRQSAPPWIRWRPELGPVEVCFSNAGIVGGGDILCPVTWKRGSRQWAVNVMGQVYAVRKVLPGMLERGDGYLIHTASMAGILIVQGDAAYTATKHAVVGLAEWLSATSHNRGVRTSLLAPLGVRTPMLWPNRMGRCGSSGMCGTRGRRPARG